MEVTPETFRCVDLLVGCALVHRKVTMVGLIEGRGAKGDRWWEVSVFSAEERRKRY